MDKMSVIELKDKLQKADIRKLIKAGYTLEEALKVVIHGSIATLDSISRLPKIRS